MNSQEYGMMMPEDIGKGYGRRPDSFIALVREFNSDSDVYQDENVIKLLN